MSKIEWLHRPDTTPEAWNPVTGCTKVSEGCRNCYAEAMAKRFWRRTPEFPAGRRFTDVMVHEWRLSYPLRWRDPRTVFVNSMSDLFHPDVPDEFIDRVFAVMALARAHTFICLTKRPDRMNAYVHGARDRVALCPNETQGRVSHLYAKDLEAHLTWPLPNVWLGVSIEDQATADQRIPILLQTPAAVRCVSAEPLLGPVGLEGYPAGESPAMHLRRQWLSEMKHLDWVIVGGESGPKARPCDLRNILSLVQQTRNAGVKCFVKQIGSRPTWDGKTPVSFMGQRIKSRNGGDPDEWIEELRVREWPEGAR